MPRGNEHPPLRPFRSSPNPARVDTTLTNFTLERILRMAQEWEVELDLAQAGALMRCETETEVDSALMILAGRNIYRRMLAADLAATSIH